MRRERRRPTRIGRYLQKRGTRSSTPRLRTTASPKEHQSKVRTQVTKFAQILHYCDIPCKSTPSSSHPTQNHTMKPTCTPAPENNRNRNKKPRGRFQ
mmetsp:Transcript_24857/g.31636  ORF Transcript_24857/g.31636 Transcript_24857/m.31636 type:complete len:97 (+) Transcript_24857:920-1210(+)